MQSLLDKKIPSVLGILIIVVGIATTTFLVKGEELFQTSAGPGDDPKNIQITNISDSSFTVTYTTDDAVIGTVRLGENSDSLDQTFLDDRDKSTQQVGDYKSHSITVDNLTPNSTYFFNIDSGDNTTTNNGAPFTVSTGPLITEESSTQISINGKLVNPDGTVPIDGIILVNINGAQKFSGYLQKDGKYNIPLNKLRAANLNNFFNLNENSIIVLDINSNGLSSKITTTSDILVSIPQVTLSHNYDFLNDEPPSNTINSDNVEYPEINSRPNTSNNVRISTSPVLSPTSIPANPSQ